MLACELKREAPSRVVETGSISMGKASRLAQMRGYSSAAIRP